MQASSRFEHRVKGPRSPKTPICPPAYASTESHSRSSSDPPSAWRPQRARNLMSRVHSAPHLHEKRNVPDVPEPSTSQNGHASEEPTTNTLEHFPPEHVSRGNTGHRRTIRPLPPVPPSPPNTSSDRASDEGPPSSIRTSMSFNTSDSSSFISTASDIIRPLPRVVTSFTTPDPYSTSPKKLRVKRVFTSQASLNSFGAGGPDSHPLPTPPTSGVHSSPISPTSPTLSFAQFTLVSPVSRRPHFPASLSKRDPDFLSREPSLPFRGVPRTSRTRPDSGAPFSLRTSVSSPSLMQDRNPSMYRSVIAPKELKIVAIEGRLQGEKDIQSVIPQLRQLKASKKMW